MSKPITMDQGEIARMAQQLKNPESQKNQARKIHVRGVTHQPDGAHSLKLGRLQIPQEDHVKWRFHAEVGGIVIV